VVFERTVDIPGKAMHSQTIKTCVFDQNTGKLLSPGDIFTGRYLNVISKKVIASFAGNKTYSVLAKTELFKENTSPKAENFLNFAVAGGKMIFYFDSLRLFPAKYGCPGAAIPLAGLYTVLKVKMTEMGVFQQITGKDKLIALTFDDGPRISTTNRILDALAKVGGRATFFMLGIMLHGKTDTVKRVYSMGCEIGNHSLSHENLAGRTITTAQIKNQIAKPNVLIKNITGESPALFRVPYGSTNAKVDKLVGMPIIAWSVDPKDWAYKDLQSKPRTKAQRDKDIKKVSDRILKAARDGDIVIMHDIYDFSADVMEKVIPELTKRGFKLVTVSELFEAKGKELKNGVVYFDARQ
jgi:peptidoglycan-N-acetylglucosamine deacetylase